MTFKVPVVLTHCAQKGQKKVGVEKVINHTPKAFVLFLGEREREQNQPKHSREHSPLPSSGKMQVQNGGFCFLVVFIGVCFVTSHGQGFIFPTLGFLFC